MVKQTPHRVLLVDDHPGIRQSVSSLLEMEGYCVDTAENGHVGLQRLRANAPPCVILLDLNMPVMDGAQFRSEQLADRHLAHIPVVIFSAIPMDAVQARPLKAAAYLTKPVNPDVLLSTINAVAIRQPVTPDRKLRARAQPALPAKPRPRITRPVSDGSDAPVPRHARMARS